MRVCTDHHRELVSNKLNYLQQEAHKYNDENGNICTASVATVNRWRTFERTTHKREHGRPPTEDVNSEN